MLCDDEYKGMLKKDDVMTTQGINVSMAYVEKSSAKAGTELALQVRAKMIWSKNKRLFATSPRVQMKLSKSTSKDI